MSEHHKKLTGATFQIDNAKLYVPVVTLSINNNMIILENKKHGFKRTVSWDKYRSEITTQTKNNNLGYLIDPTFRNIIDDLYCHSKMATVVLRENLLINITCH